MSNKLQTWVVYNSPKDFPGEFVVRRFENDKPTNSFYSDRALNNVRNWINIDAKKFPQGIPYRLNPHPKDDPVIIETWI